MKIDFPTSPKAIQVYSNDERLGFNGYMLSEDLHNSIMPYKISSKPSEFRCEIASESDADRVATISICEELSHNGYASDDTDLISEAIRGIVHNMSFCGDFACEIVYDADNEKLRLVRLPTNGLFRFFGKYLQVLPSNKTVNILDTNNIWRIEIPKALGGKRGFKRMLSRIDGFDSMGPKFFMQDMQNMKYSNHVYSSTYTRANHIYIAKSASMFGWNQRNIDANDKNEFYIFYQLLSFYHAKAILRESIVKELNKLLMRLEVKSKIIVYGLPSPENVLLFRNDFVCGNKSIADVVKFIYE